MKVSEIMTQGVATCQPESSLAEAALAMWRGDCGAVPVVEEGTLRGILTDRDICMAVATQGRPADRIQARDVMSSQVIACSPDDEVPIVHAKLARGQVHRLPVVDDNGVVLGVVSTNDLISEAKATPTKLGAPTFKEIVGTLREIGKHRDLPVPS